MNIFKRLFGSKNIVADTPIAEPEQLIEIPESLFVAQAADLEDRKEVAKRTMMQQFLSQNFFEIGRTDGYGTKYADQLKVKERQIKSEFRAVIDEDVERMKDDILAIECQLFEIGDLLPSMKQALNLKIERIREKIQDAEEQKVLSVDDEGKIAPCLFNYRSGFQRGMQEGINLQSFLAR